MQHTEHLTPILILPSIKANYSTSLAYGNCSYFQTAWVSDQRDVGVKPYTYSIRYLHKVLWYCYYLERTVLKFIKNEISDAIVSV